MDRHSTTSWLLLAAQRQGRYMRAEVYRKRLTKRLDYKTLRRLA